MSGKNLIYKNSFEEDTIRLVDLISKSATTISDKKIKSVAKQWMQIYYDLLEILDTNGKGYKAFIALSNSANNVRLRKTEWLHNLRIILKEYHNLSIANKAKKFKSPRKKNQKIFDERRLHKPVILSSRKLFSDGYYSQAIFEACKLLNKKVQELSSLSLDGKNLMLSAFSVNNPKLRLNQLQNQSDKDEQEGFMHIFAGVMQGVRNPKGHEVLSLKDPYRALEYLGLISLLFRRLNDIIS